jgi:tetratricopeptide (TPR) repeat protein
VDSQHEAALASAERAVAFGPSDPDAYTALSLVLTAMGRYADAVTAIETAIRLNPNLPVRDRIVAGLAFLLTDQPKRAIKELERARAEAPNVEEAHAMLTAAYAWAGQIEDAHVAAAEAVRLAPNLSVETYRVLLSHFRNKQDVARLLDAMRKGGFNEWPYGFTAEPSDKVPAEEIRRLAFGRTWKGRLATGEPALTQIQANGKFAFRTTNQIATGRAFVSADMFCEEIEAVSLGRPLCGFIYRRSAQTEDALEYTYVNPAKVFHFSPNQ